MSIAWINASTMDQFALKTVVDVIKKKLRRLFLFELTDSHFAQQQNL